MDFGEVLSNGKANTTTIPIADNENASEKTCGFDREKCTWSGDLWTQEAGGDSSRQQWLIHTLNGAASCMAVYLVRILINDSSHQ
jgi:hypothetical protein